MDADPCVSTSEVDELVRVNGGWARDVNGLCACSVSSLVLLQYDVPDFASQPIPLAAV
jgi:hypothetical protein